MKRTIALAMTLVLASMAGTNAFAATAAADVDLPEGWVIVAQFTPDGGISLSNQEAAQNSGLTLDSFHEEFAYQVVELVNSEREKVGLPSLYIRDDLCEKAQIRAKELDVLFSHERPGGTMAGWENIASGATIWGNGTPNAVMSSWMNSDGHKENILSPDAESIGVSCYIASNGDIFWVQCFGVY